MKEVLISIEGRGGGTKYPKGWSRLADLPVTHYGSALLHHDDFLYLFGGDNPATNSILKYSINNNSWEVTSQTGTKPSARRLHGSVIIEDNIYIYGGYTGSSVLGDLWSYNITTNSWTQKGSDAIKYGSTAFGYKIDGVNTELCILGGHSGSAYLTAGRVWSPINNTWRNLTTLPNGLLGCGFDVKDQFLYMYGGGFSAGTPQSPNLLRYNINSNTYTSLTSHSPSKYYNVCAIINNDLFSFGDLSSSTNQTNTFCKYNLSTGNWEDIPIVTGEPSIMGACSIGKLTDCFFIAGGYDNTTNKEFWVYKP